MALSLITDPAPEKGVAAVARLMKEEGLLVPAAFLGPYLGWKAEAAAGAGREKSFVCRICNHSFGYKHVLQNHERTHTGEKPFECPECRKRFTRDHHLKTHMRLHTGEKPYHCPHCDRHFVQVANLRRHLRVHTGERPYACELCSSRFSDSNQLKSHSLVHKGEKPFECRGCGGRFRRRHHLAHHKCKEALLSALIFVPPEQTEPEDLSLRNRNNNDSSGAEEDLLS